MSDPVVGRASPFKARRPFRGIRAPFRGVGLWGRYPARTNSIRNNTMVGAVAGTPGTAPTNWFLTAVGGNITSRALSTGSSDGLTYLEAEIAFSASASFDFYTDGITAITASQNQTWTASAFVQLAGGSLTNIACSMTVNEFTAAGGFLANAAQSFVPTTQSIGAQRIVLTRTLASATVGRVVQVIRVSASGAASVTLRIAAPQLEIGAIVTAPILTSGAAVTRRADALAGAYA